MGALFSCLRRKRYRRVTDTVVVEVNEEETKGVYWFRDLPKVTSRATEKLNEFQFLKRIHRFSALIENRVGEAANITPEPKGWRVVNQDHESGFKMCESLFTSVSYLLASLPPFYPKGKLKGNYNDDVPRVGTMQVDHLYAEEVARAFWDPDIELKKDWDPTMESFECVEKLAELAYVCHMVFKKFWPVTQRDCVMCSEMVPLEDDGWAVCNQSVYHQRCLCEHDKIRLQCDVTLVRPP